MKHFYKLILLVLLVPITVLAQDDISITTGIIGNGRLLGAKTYDAQSTVGVLGLDSSNNTALDSKSGQGIALKVDGTAEATLTNDQLAISGSNFQLVPGGSTFTIRDNADTTNNYLFEESGTLKIQGANAGLEITGQAGTTIKLKSPDGTCSSCSVDNADSFSCTTIAC